MVFVPPVTTHGSPTAIELAQRILQTITEYRQQRPGIGDLDIYQALQIAQRQVGGRSERLRRLILFVLIGLGIAAAILLFGLSGGR